MTEAEDKPTQSQAKNVAHAGYDKVIANWTRILGASTILLALATAGSAYFLYSTDRAIHTQVDTVRLQTRAYIVSFRTETSMNFDSPKDNNVQSFDFTVIWKNIGFTPAFEFTNFVSIQYQQNGFEPDFERAANPSLSVEPPNVIGAQNELRIGPVTISRSDILKAENGVGKIFIWGRSTYRDLFSENPSRITKFCFVARVPSKRSGDPILSRYKNECNTSS